MAETIGLQRDLSLLEYAGGRLHVATISTAESVALIRAAKTKKLNVTCSVAAHNLLLDDGCLRGFDMARPAPGPQARQAARQDGWQWRLGRQ